MAVHAAGFRHLLLDEIANGHARHYGRTMLSLGSMRCSSPSISGRAGPLPRGQSRTWTSPISGAR